MPRFLDKKKPFPTMLVRPNPKHALDHYGEPCAVVPTEIQSPGAALRYVGARIDFKRSREEKRQTYVFDAAADAAVEVAQTDYYVKKVAEGELLPACDVSRLHAQTPQAKLAARNAA